MDTLHRKKLKKRLIRTGITVVSGAAVYGAAHKIPATQHYLFRPLSRFLSERLAVFFSFVPISVAECLLLTALLAFPVFVSMAIIRSLQSKKFSLLAVYASQLLYITTLAFLLFLLLWGTNYYAPPLETFLGLKAAPATESELWDAACYYGENMNAWAVQTPRTSRGDADFGSFYNIRLHAPQGYTLLAQQYDIFYAHPMPPKAILSSRLMSYTGLAGIYMPFTGEANINTLTPDALLPFTICHELAHRQGVAPEEEANFAAFLACEKNPDPRYQYASYFAAFLYCFNELPAQQRTAMWERMHPYAQMDFQAIWEHNDAFAGPARAVSSQINDTYLKAMNQPEGVRSYGRVVDLLIAEYKRRTSLSD